MTRIRVRIALLAAPVVAAAALVALAELAGTPTMAAGEAEGVRKPQVCGSFTVAVRPAGSTHAVIREYRLSEPMRHVGQNRYEMTARYPWGEVAAEGTLDRDGNLVLTFFRVWIKEDWDDVHGEGLGFGNREQDFHAPRRLDTVNLTADGKDVALYFDETPGLHTASVAVTGSLTATGAKTTPPKRT